MKSTILLIALLFSVNTNAQDLPNFLMKGKYIYFLFDNVKLDNSKKCLSSYVDESIQTACEVKCEEINGKHKKKNAFYFGDIEAYANAMIMNYPAKCQDTAQINGLIMIPIKKNLSQITGISTIPGLIVQYNSKNLVNQALQFSGEIIFTSKNEYFIKFKGFKLINTYTEKSEEIIEELELGELYNAVKSSENPKKNEIDFFIEFNQIVDELNTMFNEVIKEAYETDEL